eukprot:2280043-Karenia_brevis.AAC.1
MKRTGSAEFVAAASAGELFPEKYSEQLALAANNEELIRWLCPTCEWTCCQVCDTEAKNGSYWQKKLQTKKHWTCAACQQKAREIVIKKHRTH